MGTSGAVIAESDDEVVAKVGKEAHTLATRFLWARLAELTTHHEGNAPRLDSPQPRQVSRAAVRIRAALSVAAAASIPELRNSF